MKPQALHSLILDDRGATLVEYSLLIALISVACVAAIGFMGAKVSSLFSSIGNVR
jgi:Flp pilus assembly pilin Flp